MGDSWIVDNLNAALNTWNGKLAEIWQLLTESPQTFRGGQVWSVMVGIHGALQAIGYGLLVLFFAIGVVKTCGSFVEVKRPEHALKLFIRFALAKAAVTYGLELMQAVFSIVQGTVSTVITQSGTSGMNSTTLPQELVDAINDVGFWDSIPLWAVTLIGGLLITVLSFVMILTVYGRMFSLWMYAAIAPIPLAAFAGEPTANVGKNFIRSYAGVCLQGLVIALSCVIFSALAASPPSVDTSASVVTAVWTYGEKDILKKAVAPKAAVRTGTHQGVAVPQRLKRRKLRLQCGSRSRIGKAVQIGQEKVLQNRIRVPRRARAEQRRTCLPRCLPDGG